MGDAELAEEAVSAAGGVTVRPAPVAGLGVDRLGHTVGGYGSADAYGW